MSNSYDELNLRIEGLKEQLTDYFRISNELTLLEKKYERFRSRYTSLSAKVSKILEKDINKKKKEADEYKPILKEYYDIKDKMNSNESSFIKTKIIPFANEMAKEFYDFVSAHDVEIAINMGERFEFSFENDDDNSFNVCILNSKENKVLSNNFKLTEYDYFSKKQVSFIYKLIVHQIIECIISKFNNHSDFRAKDSSYNYSFWVSLNY